VTRAAPWSATKADRRVVSPDEEWAAEITRKITNDCHPWQRDAVIDPARRISLRVGRGGAKTTTFRARQLIKLITLREQRLGYAATSADQARDLNWDKIKSSCEAYDIRSTAGAAWSTGSGKKTKSAGPDVSFLDTKMVMTCHRTGSVLRLRGVEDKRDAEKFRGFPQAEFDVDEAGSFPPELLEYLIDQCVAPRLGEALALDGGRGGCLGLGSTPPAQLRGLFYEVTRHGSMRHRPYSQRDDPAYAGWKGFSSHSWTLKDVYDLPDARERYPALVANWEEALVEASEKGWSQDHPIWMREYLGEWSADNTTMVFRYRPHVDEAEWNQWNPHGAQFIEGLEGLKLAIAALPLGDNGKPMTWCYAYAADTGGTRDPFALNVQAFSPQDRQRRIFHVFSFERMGMYARPIAQLLLGADESRPNGCSSPDSPRGLIGLTGWPIGQVIDGDQNLIDELANVYGVRMVKAQKQAEYKFGAIELVNGDLVDGRIKVLKGSPLEKQITVLQWKPDDFGNNREDKAQANHCLVAGTLVMTEQGERPIETVRAGDRVWTRRGLRRVTFSGQSAIAETIERDLGNGRVLRGTPDHRVFDDGQWIPLELLTPSSMVHRWESTDHQKLLCSKEGTIDAIRTGPMPAWPGTLRIPKESSFIAQYGLPRTDLFQRGCMSIIATAITQTTSSTTSRQSTDESTSARMGERRNELRCPGTTLPGSPSQPLRNGTDRLMAGPGTGSIALTRSIASGFSRAMSAESSSPPDRVRPSGVVQSASAPPTTPGCARTEPVFDLSVEGEHEFFANGVLVSNSTDTLIYARRLIAHMFESGSVSQDSAPRPDAYKDPQGLDEIDSEHSADEFSSLLSEPNWDDLVQ
jgi:hypothetical protein